MYSHTITIGNIISGVCMGNIISCTLILLSLSSGNHLLYHLLYHLPLMLTIVILIFTIPLIVTILTLILTLTIVILILIYLSYHALFLHKNTYTYYSYTKNILYILLNLTYSLRLTFFLYIYIHLL